MECRSNRRDRITVGFHRDYDMGMTHNTERRNTGGGEPTENRGPTLRAADVGLERLASGSPDHSLTRGLFQAR